MQSHGKSAMINLRLINGLAIPEKVQTPPAGVEDMEFPGVKKEHVEIPGVNQKRSGISKARVFKKNPCGISIGLGF